MFGADHPDTEGGRAQTSAQLLHLPENVVGRRPLEVKPPPARPKHLAVRPPDGRTALTQPLPSALAAQVAVHLPAADGPTLRAHTASGDSYAAVEQGLVVVEVLSGTTRHPVVTVTRLK
ncbi:hypothetical protein [Streptomyces sp. NPDC016845]|uniref:hypothetical protein n=1 Tax=Streptomyces sp. NPDC016845 TaxID=3364972 RepID=UPI0037ABCF53